MKRFASFVILGVIALSACDPVRVIRMNNKSADTAEVIFRLNEDSLLNNPFLLSNSKELKFTLYPPKRKSIEFSFGPGNWSPQEVQKLVGYLNSMEIISSTQRIRIDSLPQLKEFLLSRRKGIGGARIEIVIPK